MLPARSPSNEDQILWTTEVPWTASDRGTGEILIHSLASLHWKVRSGKGAPIANNAVGWHSPWRQQGSCSQDENTVSGTCISSAKHMHSNHTATTGVPKMWIVHMYHTLPWFTGEDSFCPSLPTQLLDVLYRTKPNYLAVPHRNRVFPKACEQLHFLFIEYAHRHSAKKKRTFGGISVPHMQVRAHSRYNLLYVWPEPLNQVTSYL